MIPTGVANLAGVLAGLRRAGACPEVAGGDVEACVRAAERVVLPGVGSFAAGMASLESLGVVDALRERVLAGRPTLAVCLGLQLLAEGSDESPGVAGLDVLPGRATRLPTGVRVPHMGWSPITAADGGSLRAGHAYFAHSFRLQVPPPGWRVAWCEEGGRFVAAIERGSVLACQFHPELSGRLGDTLLRSWLEASCRRPA